MRYTLVLPLLLSMLLPGVVVAKEELVLELPLGARIYELPAGSESFTFDGKEYVLTPRGNYLHYDARNQVFIVVMPPQPRDQALSGRTYPYLAPEPPPAPPPAAGVPRAYPPPLYAPPPQPHAYQLDPRDSECRDIASQLSRLYIDSDSVNTRKAQRFRAEYERCMRNR